MTDVDNKKTTPPALAYLFCLSVAVFVWYKFIKTATAPTYVQAACVDGQFIDQSDAIQVSVVKEYGGRGDPITFDCIFPVASYLCDSPECSTWASTPMWEKDELPERREESGVYDCEGECEDCASGKCDAYKKATDECVALARIIPYKCFVHPNADEVLLEDEFLEKFGDKMSLLGPSILAFVGVVGVTVYGIYKGRQEGLTLTDMAVKVLVMACFAGTLVAIIQAIMYAVRHNEPVTKVYDTNDLPGISPTTIMPSRSTTANVSVNSTVITLSVRSNTTFLAR